MRHFQVLVVSFSGGVSVLIFEFQLFQFRVLGTSFSSSVSLVLRSSVSSASK